MFNTHLNRFDEKYLYQRNFTFLNSFSNKIYENSQFLIEAINYNKNNCNNRNQNNNIYDQYTPELNNNMTRTQPNFYNKYDYYKFKSYCYQNNFCENSNMVEQMMKNDEKKLKILSQNYNENYNDIINKDIATYPYGINLNISNYETQEPINKNNNNPDFKLFKKIKGNNNCTKKRMITSKSFSNIFYNISNKIKLTKYKPKGKILNKIEKANLSFGPYNKYHSVSNSNNTFNDFSKNKSISKKDYNCEVSSLNILQENYQKRIESFINKLEQYFIYSIKYFFAFFIHRLNIYAKIREIKFINFPFLLHKSIKRKDYTTYKNTFNNKINKSMENSNIPEDNILRNEKKNNICEKRIKENIHYNHKFKDIKINKKHVQFSRDNYIYKNIKTTKKIITNLNTKDKTEQNINTNFNSNGLKSTNYKSSLEISRKISNNSLTPNKTNIDTFSEGSENIIINKYSRNKDSAYYKSRNKNSIYNICITQNRDNIYSKKKKEIYKKPNIEDLKIFKIDKKLNNPKNNNNFNKQVESPIKSLIIKKKNISKGNCFEKNEKDILKEIIIKELQSQDKRINIFIKYMFSDKSINDFKKAKIRRKILSFQTIKNIFLDNHVDILKPLKIESFDLCPMITILKTNITSNDNDKLEKDKKLSNLNNILNCLYQKYIAYFLELFFNNFESLYYKKNNLICNLDDTTKINELNNINISCITNNLTDNREKEIIVEENYSLNNDIDNDLHSSNNKKENGSSEICLSDKIIFLDNKINEKYINTNDNIHFNERLNPIRNAINYYNIQEKNIKKQNNKEDMNIKLEKWKSGTMDEKKLFRIKIEKFKICRSLLKNIDIKKEKIGKIKIDKIKNLIGIIENRSDDNYNNSLKLLKDNFETWRKNIGQINSRNINHLNANNIENFIGFEENKNINKLASPENNHSKNNINNIVDINTTGNNKIANNDNFDVIIDKKEF